MTNSGLSSNNNIPLWLIAELTYKCPLECAYCSNPVDYAGNKQPELSTAEWQRVLTEARTLGAVQLGLTGGEPAIRKDLSTIIKHASELGFYTNLITSGIGLDATHLAELKDYGLDHVQLSIQGVDEHSATVVANRAYFERKMAIARAIKSLGYPMVLNVVLHKHNIHQTEDIVRLAIELEADYVELANTQYYGWAAHNRNALLPSREQVKQSYAIVKRYQATHTSTKFLYVVPDYHENTPKACVNKWGSTMMLISPHGFALPCHSAQMLPLPQVNVRDTSLAVIWQESELFNYFRGTEWMPEPCASSDNKHSDHGGCRCQAYMLTGDMHATDPVCHKSTHHALIESYVTAASAPTTATPLVFRTHRNSLVHNT